MTDRLLIKNVRPFGGANTRILIEDGVIAKIADDQLARAGVAEFDAAGALALPGLINAHCHLDKTRWGEAWQPHPAGPERSARIAADRACRGDLVTTTQVRAARLVEQCIATGTTHIRSHVDVEPEFGLAAVEALLGLREALLGKVDIQLVAFPQFGVITNPGTDTLLEAAVRAGADCVGGIDPSSIDGDAAGQLDAIFAIAERCDAGIDIHLHETGEEGAASLEMICQRSRALGMAGRVAVSHAFCLGGVDDVRLAGLIDGLAAAGVSIVTYAPGRAPVPPLKRLIEAGVGVALGTDGIRDSWTPFGNGDMLERAMMLAYRLDYRRDEDIALALEAAIGGGAALMGLQNHGLEPGCRADLMLIDAETVAEAVVGRSPRRATFKGGLRVG